MLPAHLRQQAFQERRHEVVEAVHGSNPNNTALRAQLAHAEHDLEATRTAIRVLEVK
jgi:hypothetical protein